MSESNNEIIFLLERIRGLKHTKSELSKEQARIDNTIRDLQLKVDLIVQKTFDEMMPKLTTPEDFDRPKSNT